MTNKDVPYDDEATKERYQQDQLRMESGLNHNEEYAAEIAVPAPVRKITYAEQYRSAKMNKTAAAVESAAVSDEEVDEMVDAVTRSKAIGYVALFVALASLFVWPVLLGASGIVLGIIAFFYGNKALGSWSIGLGLVAIAAYYFLLPFYS
ncbi:hypothetical protein [Paenibacillus aestuarii]|uniref:DUF4190 domain-containing protein n=1 Tax=Paenibacillus aestuarii TaxID=516965 RepID=A0ABW0KA30_9BACL|nr:hypothetical protein [Paenibacillus aestuarii]